MLQIIKSINFDDYKISHSELYVILKVIMNHQEYWKADPLLAIRAIVRNGIVNEKYENAAWSVMYTILHQTSFPLHVQDVYPELITTLDQIIMENTES